MSVLTRLTAAPYADWLVSRLRDAADQERDTLYRARLAAAVTLRVVVTRHKCPHCGRTWSKQPAAAAHVARCWHNPAVRSCKTCEHHQPAYRGDTCNPGEWCACSDYPEACDVDAVPAGATFFPITDCPKWQPISLENTP